MHRVEDHLHHNCATRQTLAAVTGDTVDGTALGSLAPVKVTGGNPHITVSAGCSTKLAGGGDQHSPGSRRPIDMTVPAYRAGTGPQPDPLPAAARAAVDDLFRLHVVDLVRFALMLVGDQSTAEDVVQDAFLGLYRAWNRVRDPDAVLGYLRTAVVNGARSVHRSRGRARLMRVQHDPPVWSAEAAVMDGEDRRAVLAAIATLPKRQREVLALKYYLNLSERDVAAIMRVSRGTVASASSRALAALARRLREDQ
jgi:RNA polymerase sigma-70 factor (sigma-E family)